MAEFWITAPRYIKQVHQMDPQHVAATPFNPVKVILPDDFVVSKHDKTMKAVKPEKPAPARAVRKDVRGVPKASEVEGIKEAIASDEAKKKSTRASDR